MECRKYEHETQQHLNNMTENIIVRRWQDNNNDSCSSIGLNKDTRQQQQQFVRERMHEKFQLWILLAGFSHIL